MHSSKNRRHHRGGNRKEEDTSPQPIRFRDGKNLGSFFKKNWVFRFSFRFLGFNLQMPDTKYMTHKQRFGHVNATNRNLYLSIIYIKLVTQTEKFKKKTKIRTFDSRFLGF